MPRNVDPGLRALPGVEVLDLDTIRVHAPIDEFATMNEARLIVHTAAQRHAAARRVEVAAREHDIGPEGALYAGSPETVARKIAATVKTLGADRFDLKYANGTLDHGKLLHSIELYGEVVAPMVHDLLARG